jgi:NTP pyrophosphatase (non-canonical NTP hydrolase)
MKRSDMQFIDENFIEIRETLVPVISDVINERVRQNALWGFQQNEPGIWLAIFMEEVGEVAQALQQNKSWFKGSDSDDLYTELIHAAAVAIQWAEFIKKKG